MLAAAAGPAGVRPHLDGLLSSIVRTASWKGPVVKQFGSANSSVASETFQDEFGRREEALEAAGLAGQA